MNIEQYSISADNSHLTYKFKSVGPKGVIRKLVTYSRIKGAGETIYNLSFGDWNELSGASDSETISNNGDTYKVLITVAFTSVQFFSFFPEAEIFFTGSTESRTRLYQRVLGSNILEINKQFIVKGLINGYWEEFKVGINYQAFLVKKKIN